jgi:hypothetical protein
VASKNRQYYFSLWSLEKNRKREIY